MPKTPDAIDHMPEQMKSEYRRLKEQLAQREKTRLPLTNINQDKGVEIVATDESFFIQTSRKRTPFGPSIAVCLQEVSAHEKLQNTFTKHHRG